MSISIIISPDFRPVGKEFRTIRSWAEGIFGKGNVSIHTHMYAERFMSRLKDCFMSENEMPELAQSWPDRYLIVKGSDVNYKRSLKIETGSPSLSDFFGNTVNL